MMGAVTLHETAALYVIGINAFAFLLYGADKFLAVKGFWRFRDSTLIAIALFGGTIGAIAGQRIFRHKTKKYRFVMPSVLLAQIAIGAYLLMGSSHA